MARPALTVYGRAWCHLCDDLRAELAPIAAEFGVAINVIDIDSDPALEAVYNELVPILMFEGAELSQEHRHFLPVAQAGCRRHVRGASRHP